MSKKSRPRRGSLQFYPRKRAAKLLPSVNWDPINSKPNSIPGFITYKVGMATAIVKDSTEKSMTSKKRIAIPVTILEAPNMKAYSIRFYKNKKLLKDIVVSNDKELKPKLKVTKTLKKIESEIPDDYDNIHLIVYSIPKQTSIKKKPDMIEIALFGETKEAKLGLAKSVAGKEIILADFIKSIDENAKLVDARGVTKGKGTQGPVKRFGIRLRHHKSEKGVRKVGSIGPWHPARLTFRVPMAGQLGLFSRVNYNQKIIDHGLISEKDINPQHGFRNYGKIKSSYIIIKGSVSGPAKRQILLTPSFRPTKLKAKAKYELQELITK